MYHLGRAIACGALARSRLPDQAPRLWAARPPWSQAPIRFDAPKSQAFIVLDDPDTKSDALADYIRGFEALPSSGA